MFWGSKKLKRNAGLYGTIKPFNEKNVAHGAYELTMGDTYYSTDLKTSQKLQLGEMFRISAGQFALLETKEVVKIPRNAIGLISIKGTIKLKGLVNVSGFHVDPGFEGRLVFSVYNAGGGHIHLRNSDPVFLLWFCDLDLDNEDGYNGNSNQGITPMMVDSIGKKIASPSDLNKRLSCLETSFKIAATAITVVVTIVVGWLTVFITGFGSSLLQLVESMAKLK